MSNWKTIATAHLTINGTVKEGHSKGKAFTFNGDAILSEMPKDDPFHYGTGCYLTVKGGEMPYHLDVRYEGTRDIRTLLDRWIEGHWGENADTVTITVN